MDHYIDIRLRDDPETTSPELMSTLFSKVHRRLVALESTDIGVSFPEHGKHPRTLGGVLRLHGSAQRLAQLMSFEWLMGMRDYVLVSEIAEVPRDTQHRLVRRRQFKTNADRLRRRHMKRHQVSEDVARERIPYSVERKVTLPFVMIRSQSTGESFSLFIEHDALRTEPTKGEFNRYGLSASATVPWF